MMQYKNPANDWMNGLPIGNGRLAAMVWGEKEDIVSLNHEKLWTGITRNRENYYVAPEALGQVRELLDNEDMFRAAALANTWFGGIGGISYIPGRIDPYQPAGDIIFSLVEDCDFQKRELDILNGVCKSIRKTKNAEVALETYAEATGGSIVCRWSSDRIFSGRLTFKRTPDERVEESTSVNEKCIKFECKFKEGIAFSVVVAFKTDGTAIPNGDYVEIKDAKTLLVTADIAVLENDNDKCELSESVDINYDESLLRHKEIFSEEMQRFSLSVEGESIELPTNERVEAIRQGKTDDGLIMLFYNFGRYLMLSSSLCGELPANLQGKWNHDINPPWRSDYHFNINLQMNYWLAEPTNCPECADKLLKLVELFIPHGKQAARDLYGCRGVWLPQAADRWGRATPEAFGFAVWISGAAWMVQHFYWRYLYSGDIEFLKERCYPFLKDVALFYEDYIVKDKFGEYQIYPSQSPENAFKGEGIFPLCICKSAAMDVQLAYMALSYAIEAAEILNVDSESVEIWKKLRDNLPEFKIGRDGRLLEWDKEYIEVDPGHRHMSHLVGVFPIDLFTEDRNPKQYAAAKKSLDFRMNVGGGHTGWSRAWVACLYARFGEGEKVYEHVSELIKEFATESLLDTHPQKDGSVFQIDGNFGAVAAINEMIGQARNGKLYLLYALPEKWKNGEINGLKTPGGHTVYMKWENGKPKQIKVIIGFDKKLICVYNKEEIIFEGNPGEEIIVNYQEELK